MATVHSYARFSDPKQAKGDSERRQDELLQKFVESGKHTLSDLQYIDKGKSGFKGNKQKWLNEFLKILRSKDGRINQGDILFVEAVDRLSRKGIRATQEVVNEIFSHGVDIRIVSPVEKTYRADAVNDLGDAIELAAFAFAANTYSSLLSSRIKSFHQQSRKNAYEGKIIYSGSPPSWLTRTREKFAFIPGAKEIIEFIFQQTINGFGGRQLVKLLNQKFKPFGANKVWNEQFLRMTLNDRRALGEYQPHLIDDFGKRVPTGEPIPAYYPAAIDEITWQLAQVAVANRRVEKGPSGQFVNLFTGLVLNGIDKTTMQVWTYQQKRVSGEKTIHRRLKSQAATAGLKNCCIETLRLADFEFAVLKVLKELDVSVFSSDKSPALELASLVKNIEIKKKRIADIESDETSPVNLLSKQLMKLNDEVAEMQKQVDLLKATQANSVVENLNHIRFLTNLDNTGENRQKLREAIKRVVKRITVLPIKLGNQRKSPVGSFIELELVSGKRRQVMQLGQKVSPTITFDAPTDPPLFEKINLKDKIAAAKKWLLFAKGL